MVVSCDKVGVSEIKVPADLRAREGARSERELSGPYLAANTALSITSLWTLTARVTGHERPR